MSQTFRCKDYNGSVVYSDEDEILHGRILGIRDVVTFEGRERKGTQGEFCTSRG